MALKGGTQVWMWDRCYGRDGRSTPTELNESVLAQEAANVELTLNSLPRRRAGYSRVLGPVSGVGGYYKIARYYGAYDSATPDEYLFWTDGTQKQWRARFTGAAPTPIEIVATPPDNFSVDGRESSFVQFNGKMYRAASSLYDRLHVSTPDAPNTLRRVGIFRPPTPTLTEVTGGPGGLRYYRVQYKVKIGGRTRRVSTLGDPTGWTPPAGTRITPDFVSIDESAAVTHWVVWASQDNALYFDISGDLDRATTPFFDDLIAPGDYPNYPSAPDEGAFNTWPSVRFLLAGIDRLFGLGGFGGQEARAGNASQAGRVWWSPVLGTSTGTNAMDDDERVPVVLAGSTPIQNWIDVGRGMGEEDRGLGGPIDGMVLVFQARGVYLLIPTGNVLAPFKRVTISTDVGAVEGSIFTGQDEMGRPCVYWIDESAGPYRYGSQGLQWLGYDVADQIALFNRTAPPYQRAHGVFSNETQVAHFWICQTTTPGAGAPNRGLRFHARLGKDTGPTGVRFGWVVDEHPWGNTLSSAVARRSLLDPVAIDHPTFQPVVATANTINMRDAAQWTDDGQVYGAFVRSKVIALAGAAFQVKQLITDWLYVQALRVAANLHVSLWRNFDQDVGGAVSRSLAPPAEGNEERVLLRYEGLSVQDAYALQVQIADPPFVGNTANWLVDHVALPIEIRTQERWNT